MHDRREAIQCEKKAAYAAFFYASRFTRRLLYRAIAGPVFTLLDQTGTKR